MYSQVNITFLILTCAELDILKITTFVYQYLFYVKYIAMNIKTYCEKILGSISHFIFPMMADLLNKSYWRFKNEALISFVVSAQMWWEHRGEASSFTALSSSKYRVPPSHSGLQEHALPNINGILWTQKYPGDHGFYAVFRSTARRTHGKSQFKSPNHIESLYSNIWLWILVDFSRLSV